MFFTTIATLLIKSCLGEFANEGYCLDLPGGDPCNGAQLWLWECQWATGLNQIFGDGVSESGSTIPYGDFCVDAGNMEEGFRLMLWECNGYDQQTFYCESHIDTSDDVDCMSLRTSSGLCVSASSRRNGAPVKLHLCDSKQWSFVEDKYLECLRREGGARSVHEALFIRPSDWKRFLKHGLPRWTVSHARAKNVVRTHSTIPSHHVVSSMLVALCDRPELVVPRLMRFTFSRPGVPSAQEGQTSVWRGLLVDESVSVPPAAENLGVLQLIKCTHKLTVLSTTNTPWDPRFCQSFGKKSN